MEFFEGINEIRCCNNRITTEISRDGKVPDIERFELQ